MPNPFAPAFDSDSSDLGVQNAGLPDLDEQPQSTPKMPSFDNPGTSFNPSFQTHQPVGAPHQQVPDGRDVELILARLDTIKAEIDSMSQRIKHIERIAESGENKTKYKW